MRRIFFIFQKFAVTIFSRVIAKKPSKIVKFTKIHQTLRNTYLTWPKRNRIKLVVSPNLLKQENVCLISRETEHPSKNNESIEPLTCLLRAFLTHNIALLWRGIASVYFIKGSLIFLRTLGILWMGYLYEYFWIHPTLHLQFFVYLLIRHGRYFLACYLLLGQ